jgi:hypothetical protein
MWGKLARMADVHPFDDRAKSLRDLADEVERAEEALAYWRDLRNAAIGRRLDEGATWDQVESEARVSRATVAAARRAYPAAGPSPSA